ncbi:MAG: hypothetical protein A3J58_00365 [Candidatus Sungbacteria bacterium RIFCSPHIGHO2_02_FULL_52_23]|uniref:Uncharacterized protein n=1 Tax=Candidatus Sungbacteria bacterium RIFCSPHIGHO2_02_FULL_52_23 TaxID=1802274 RepID=A0A1G2KW02_9BACT|nr:MAG: hypothetical protein A3J58_00365 [Candidatus Sungbacteria bacterium RIFCSPHIGHO2_02_FULL_52_23]
MNLYYSPRLKADIRKISKEIRQKFYKQAELLRRNLSHPSLRAKKYNEAEDIWQARIDRKYRFYFRIERDTYTLITIKRHSD